VLSFLSGFFGSSDGGASKPTIVPSLVVRFMIVALAWLFVSCLSLERGLQFHFRDN
jgi:hypothetical protein